ncbi:MAG TPA: signal peptidase I [Arthrobacter sp.]
MTAIVASGAREPGHRAGGLLRKAASAAATGLLVLGVIAFLLLAIGPRLMGYQTATMLTGSMAPLINPGDVVVTAPMAAADLRVGDIITYSIPVEDHRVVTHRVIEILTDPGATAVRTKGDANSGADPWTATLQGDTVYRQVAVIPHLGDAIRALREPLVRTVLMYGAPALLVVGLLSAIWRPKPDDDA